MTVREAQPISTARLDPPTPRREEGALDRVTLVEQSGFHGYLDPYPNPDSFGSGPVGGAAWHSTEIRAQREEHGEVLLMSGGDIFTGPDLAMKFHGAPVVDVMNHDRYDLWTLGNHDLDKGQAVLAKLIDQAEFPVLAANLRDEQGRPVWETDHPLHKVQPYLVRKMGGADVAVVGMMKPNTSELSHPDVVAGLRFEDPQTTLRELIPELMRDHRPDCVVLHYQYLHQAPELCRQVRESAEAEVGYAPYVVAVGGHGYEEFDRPVEGPGSLIVQSTDRGASLNFLQLRFDSESRQVVGYEHDYLPVLPDEILPDPEILALLDRYREQLAEEEEDFVLAVARGDFPRHKMVDSPVGNLLTDALREATTADVAFLAGGTIKAPIHQGPVARSTLREVVPFENRAVTMMLTGRQLREVLEQSLEPDIGSGKVLQMSGLEVGYDPEQSLGNRVNEVVLEDGSPLQDEREYRVALDDFLARGGDGYTAFSGGREVEEGELVRELVARVLEEKRVLFPVPAGTRLRAN